MAENITPQGYALGGDPKSLHPFWSDPTFSLEEGYKKRIEKLESDVANLEIDVQNIDADIAAAQADILIIKKEIVDIKEKVKAVALTPLSYGAKHHFEVLGSNTFTQVINWHWDDETGPVPGVTTDKVFALTFYPVQGQDVEVTKVRLKKVEEITNELPFPFVRTTFEYTIGGLALSGDVYMVATCFPGVLSENK